MANKIKLEIPNENPDIANEGPQPTVTSAPAKIHVPVAPRSSLPVLPPGIAGVWHSHKKQGQQPSDANVQVPGATYAMIVNGTDDDYVSLLIRTDMRRPCFRFQCRPRLL